MFGLALTSEAVVNKIDNVISASLRIDITKLTESNEKLSIELSTSREMHTETTKQVNQLKTSLEKKDEEIAALRTALDHTEIKLDEHEQYSRRNSLRISGVTESEMEDVGAKTLDVFNKRMKLDKPITPDHIHRVHRVGPRKEGTARAVLVKFATYKTRNKIFRGRFYLNPRKQNDDNADLPHMYINEHLTKLQAALLWKGRQLKKEKKIPDCLSADCNKK